jgi:hypothetical protein
MTERQRILDEIVDAMHVVDDELRLPARLWNALAEAALKVIETPPSTDVEIIPCTCGHNGYGTHMIGCALYGN